jgi:outer membrane protein OmpA-like peptidoglycan-associated protein
MKLYQIILPVLIAAGLPLQAQKSTHKFAGNMVALGTQTVKTSATTTPAVVPSENNKKIGFINCWITPLSNAINSQYPDYTPVLNAQGNLMYFTSRRKGNVGNKKTIDGVYKAEDIYVASKNVDGFWNPATPLGGKINTNKNEAITWMAADGKKIIICQNEDMFESSLVNGVWSKPAAMQLINSTYRETHATYSPDGNTLFFTTDDPALATVGGLDICMVKRDASSGAWGEPMLVPNINTALNEESPIIMADGKTLYFSSQGFEGMGGYDIFKTTLGQDMVPATPTNLGFPLNSAGNEPFISFEADGKKALLSSDRGADRQQDIYEVTFLDNLTIPLLVEVYDADTKELINSTVKVIDGKKGHQEIYMDNVTPGVFGADELNLGTHYVVQANATNYTGQEVVVSTAGLKEFNPDTFKLVQKIYLKADKKDTDLADDLKLSMVHFNFNKAILTSDALGILGRIKDFLVAHPTAHIIVKGHTDSEGTNTFNNRLSQKRAHAVAEWLLNNGIDQDRIITQGFGEEQPAVDNNNDDNRAKNRRAEVEIIF